MNKVILSGRLTADPELRQTQSGVSTCKFTIACDRKFADKATGERQADFITCIAWRQTAEFVSRYFNKGKMIVVEGSLRNNNYQDKNHPDVTHYTMDVLVDNVEFAGDKGGQTSAPAPAQQTAPQQTESNTDSMDYGSLSDFEEILSDGTVPF
jgi:single-strand DNA-binding protein